MSDQIADVTDTALTLIDSADNATVTLLDGRIRTSTSDESATLTQLQLDAGHGPTIDALQGRIARINYVTDTPWSDVREFCVAHEIRSALAVPIVLDGETVAAITITSVDHHAFGAPEIRLGKEVAASLAQALAAERQSAE